MNKIILTKEQVYQLVSKNRYRIDKKKKFFSRCIDGRYKNKIRNLDLPALTFPGADVGELALIFATSNIYGFEVDKEKVFKSLIEVIGGEKNFHFHSDHHSDLKVEASGCGHWRQINLDPAAYNLEKKQIKFIQEKLKQLKKSETEEIILEGEHLEGAILIISGQEGIYPRYILSSKSFSDEEDRVVEIQVFIYQQTLVDERHQAWVKKLIENKAVKLYPKCDANYLYQVLSEMAENHLFETAKRLAKRLPIFKVNFETGGGFEVKEMGKVI